MGGQNVLKVMTHFIFHHKVSNLAALCNNVHTVLEYQRMDTETHNSWTLVHICTPVCGTETPKVTNKHNKDKTQGLH